MTPAGAREGRDPYFGKILQGLGGHLDPQAFEECVQDLLREAFPGLVGVHGGSDAGMDGAIADGEGEPFALAATTSSDFQEVTRNLEQSIRARIAADDTRRRVVLATSRELPAAERRRLQQKARELDFVLVQIFDRRNLASRLYRDSRWTRTLLGVIGEPPGLSALPATGSPPLDVELVGRDRDLEWLRDASGDRLLVGEPGSGKTFLLSRLVAEGRALFLGTSDETRFADACREQEPEMVLVDDAHLDPHGVEHLRRVRRDIRGEFDLVATSWPGRADEVADALGASASDRVRRLELLTPREILQVLRLIGVWEQDDHPYLAELVSQAANRPGLAATLGRLWLRGEHLEVLTGRAISRSLVPRLRRMMERDPRQLLAAFALGGSRGMGLTAVAEFLETGIGDVWEVAAEVGSCGVLTERGRDPDGEAVLAVQPATLRVALLHEVFFSSPGRAWEPLLRRAPSIASGVEALALAALREVPVPRPELRRVVAEAGSTEAWRIFALLGQREGEWVLEEYPGRSTDIARRVLATAPRAAIRRLLEEAERPADSPGRPGSGPLRILEDWIQEISPSGDFVDESLRRRRHVVDEGAAYGRDGGNATVALRAALLALSPRLESDRWVATGDALMHRHWSLPARVVPELLELWRKLRGTIGELNPESWAELSRALHWWIHPDLPRESLTEEDRDQFHAGVREILSDLVPLAKDHPGLDAGVRELADDVGLVLKGSPDPVFQTLFPSLPPASSREGLPAALEAQRKIARGLGERWSEKAPGAAARELSRYLAEAEWSRRSGGDRGVLFELGAGLARTVAEPAEWLEALLDEEAPSGLVRPLLSRLAEERPPHWRGLLERCLETAAWSQTAAEAILRLEEPPYDLLAQALRMAEPQVVETACLRGKVPTRTLRRLLTHSDPAITTATAVGEWLAEPRGEVRAEIGEEWRTALLRDSATAVDHGDRERYWLGEILSADPGLSLAWLRALSSGEEGRPLLVAGDELVSAAVGVLAEEDRTLLLAELDPDRASAALVRQLVETSPELYRELSERRDLRAYHLAPLEGKVPDADWARLAELALKAGHEPAEVAEASFRLVGAYTPTVEHFQKWEAAFRELAGSSDSALREVARHGLDRAEELVAKARRRERGLGLAGHA